MGVSLIFSRRIRKKKFPDCVRIIQLILHFNLFLPLLVSALGDFWGKVAGAAVTGLPGILLQLIVIPVLVTALKRSGVLYGRG